GTLRIGHKLYNVFLNEADEWSRRLNTCLSEWALETHEPLPEQAEALAHSLAGASGTVGFESLSEVARALEHALESVAARQQEGWRAPASLGRTFADAGEDIRRLLHQFAAGFLKDANPGVMADLARALHDPQSFESAEPEPVEVADDVFLQMSDEVELLPADEEQPAAVAPEAAPPQQPEPAAEVQSEPPLEPPPSLPHTEPAALSSWAPLVEAPAAAVPAEAAHVRQDIDDDIDAIDTIDVDLFPIFAEEAQELLPQL